MEKKERIKNCSKLKEMKEIWQRKAKCDSELRSYATEKLTE